MRNPVFLIILSAVLCLGACSPSLSTSPGAFQLPASAPEAQTTSTSRTISVSGAAEVMVVPDEVVLTLGVETFDPQLSLAKSKNDSIVTSVLAITKDMQIDPKFVQTDYMNIEPSYDNNTYTKRIFLGYFVRKNVVITQKDVTRFEELLSRALEAGVNYVHGVDFRTTELRKYRDQARSLALQAAQEKAAAMSKELGQSIAQPLNIREDYNRWYYPWNSWWGSSYGSQMAQNVVQNAGGETPLESDAGIALGQIAISASVTVDFELK